MQTTAIPKNHMDIPWHDFTDAEKDEPVSKASLKEKASVIGRGGMMFLSCGTGACPQFHEYDFTKSRNYMFDRYRSDVD